MRTQFFDLDRPKQAAKNLCRLAGKAKLSHVQEALARVLGYRDWHDLAVNAQQDGPKTLPEIGIKDAMCVIVELADALGVPYAKVQYAVSKARLLRAKPWSLDEQLTLRASIWRLRHFGTPGRGKTGTVVKDNAHRADTPAYLRRAGRPTYLFFDTGLGERADFEVVTPRLPLPDFVPARLWLPYGVWKLKDGTEVIFSRDYFPMWGISENHVERLAPWIWVKDIVDQSHFWKAGIGGWAGTSVRKMAIDRLQANRISELPLLVDIMPYLFEAGIDSMIDGLRELYLAEGKGAVAPPYGELNARILG